MDLEGGTVYGAGDPDQKVKFAAVLDTSKASIQADRLEKILLFLRVHSSSSNMLPSFVIEEVISFVSSESLQSVWTQLLSLPDKAFSTAKYYSNVLFNAHRSWAHLITEGKVPELSRQGYLSTMATSFCVALGGDLLSDGQKARWGRIAWHLSTEAKRYIFKQISQSSPLADLSLRYLDADMSLDFLSAYLSSVKHSALTQHCAKLTAEQEAILRSLIAACINKWGVDIVYERILQHILQEDAAASIVRCFEGQRDVLLRFCQLVAQTWGSATVIRRGKKDLHCYLTALLLSIVPNLSQHELMASQGANQSTLSYLSMGVSACLDAVDAGLRSRAMKVAKAFSTVMGVELNYDESADEPPQISEKKRTQKNPPKPSGHDSDSEWESDLEAYLIPSDEEDKLDTESSHEAATSGSHETNSFRTNYLRVCLEYLQLPESADDRRSKHIAALAGIPRIVKSHPEDVRDMCGPLLKEVLRMSNNFNIDQFESLRVEAALSMYTTYPQYSVPILTWAVSHQSLAMSTRLEAVAILVKGAYTLSGVPAPGTDTSKFGTLQPTEAGEATIRPTDGPADVRRLGTTVVKRPKKLAAMKREQSYKHNHFGLIAEAVFSPVAAIASALLAADTKAVTSVESDIALTDILRYQKVGVKEINSSFNGPPLVSKRLHELKDGIDLLLPSQCMLALACFTRCSVNAVCQRHITVATLELAYALKEVPALQLRRSAAVCLHASVESWFHLKRTAESAARIRREQLMNGESSYLTPMNYITNLSSMLVDSSIADGGMDSDPANIKIMEVLAWATKVVHSESDVGCKSLYMDMLRSAVDGMS